ncbi:MAG: D-glycero-beta-D-manno-heptose-7-phosphate kinase [Nitrospirae bacterium]|nr:D-glycero-beta-D-manno-heptose-7-phosphate kinase [Nitrospirota bacterium]
MDKDKLKEIISRFPQGKVLVIGDLILDEFVWGNVSRISPEAPIPIVEVVKETFMPGGAANVSNNVYSLGGKTFLSGVVGTGPAGNILRETLSQRGIDTRGIIIDKGRPTTLKTRIIAHHQQVVRVDREKKEFLKDSPLEKILTCCQELANEVDIIAIEDYGKGVVTRELLQVMRRIKGKTIIIDPRVGSFSHYEGMDIITPNRHEAEVALGKKIDNEKSLQEGGRELLRNLHCQAALITLGEEGMCLFQREDGGVHIPTVAREVYDVSGAGDTVVATLSLALSVGASLQEAAYLSNMAAGIVVGKAGTAMVSREELVRIVDDH